MTDSKNIELNSKPVLVACDDGFAETKIVLENGEEFLCPSMVRQGGILGSANEEVHSYETKNTDGESVTYTATGTFDTAAMNTRHDAYPFSPENRVMIHHALRRSGLAGRKVHLATSLPVADYFDGEQVNHNYLEMKSANLTARVTSTSGDACAEIVSSRVYAEGVAAWVDYSVTSKGEIVVKLKRTAAIIDIGGRTTDTVKVLQQMSIDAASSGTCNVGVLNVYDELAHSIARHPEIIANFPRIKPSSVPRYVIDNVLRMGVYDDQGMHIDMRREVKEAKSLVAAKIFRDVEQRIGSGFDLEHMIFVGGGATVFEEEIKSKFKFKMVDIVERPEFANARGMMKMLRLS